MPVDFNYRTELRRKFLGPDKERESVDTHRRPARRAKLGDPVVAVTQHATTGPDRQHRCQKCPAQAWLPCHPQRHQRLRLERRHSRLSGNTNASSVTEHLAGVNTAAGMYGESGIDPE